MLVPIIEVDKGRRQCTHVLVMTRFREYPFTQDERLLAEEYAQMALVSNKVSS